jgi:iron complex outermembrane recepter protein
MNRTGCRSTLRWARRLVQPKKGSLLSFITSTRGALRTLFGQPPAVALCLLAATATVSAASSLDKSVTLDIAPQALDSALLEFSHQSGVHVMSAATSLGDKKSPGVKGTLRADAALKELLDDSGLSYKESGNSVLVVPAGEKWQRVASLDGAEINAESAQDVPSGASQASTSATSASDTESPNSADKKATRQLEEVVVTGSNIRGVSSDAEPIQIYTQDQIKMTGATTLEEFFDKLPQNFNSMRADAPSATSGSSIENALGVNGVDLRGLGIGTTLVLLNGRRLAPSANGESVDISLIPIADVERVEVLTDGASAIYGSDAVGGVVNFILKDHVEGAETTLGGGTVTKGSHSTSNAQQAFGHDWGTGSALISIGYSGQTPLMASDRDYAKEAGTFTLLEGYDRQNVFVDAKEDVTESLRLFADALYSRESNHSNSIDGEFQPPWEEDLHSRKADVFVTVGGDVRLPHDWNLEVASVLSRETEDDDGIYVSPVGVSNRAKDIEVSAKLDGRVIELPSGNIKVAVGGGGTSERLDSTDTNSGSTTSIDLSRRTEYAFGELFIPLVEEQQTIPAIERLELTGAARYTHYSDFGGNTSPKVSLLWMPISSLKFRGSYSESFRAPFLNQLVPFNSSWSVLPLSFYPVVASQFQLPQTANLLYAAGDNPNLRPERSHLKTAGLDFSPSFIQGLSLSATYFDIDYDQRITAPNVRLALGKPGTYSFLYNTRPTLSEVESIIGGQNTYLIPGVNGANAQSVLDATSLVLDVRDQNFAVTEVSGLDFSAQYRISAISIGSQASKIFHYRSQLNPVTPFLPGDNIVGSPVGFRDRTWLGVDYGAFGAQLSANYTGSYSNPDDPASPHIGSWLTFDLAARYKFESQNGLAHGLQLSVSVQNLLDHNPPYVGLSQGNTPGLIVPIGYDPANANPLGRFVSVELDKRW